MYSGKWMLSPIYPQPFNTFITPQKPHNNPFQEKNPKPYETIKKIIPTRVRLCPEVEMEEMELVESAFSDIAAFEGGDVSSARFRV